MALDYLTAPGESKSLLHARFGDLCANTNISECTTSSVDVERAFSRGRLTINYLQHQMSARKFQAYMAVGSGFGTPLLPDVDRVALILELNM
jgi:hypothetical protein